MARPSIDLEKKVTKIEQWDLFEILHLKLRKDEGGEGNIIIWGKWNQLFRDLSLSHRRRIQKKYWVEFIQKCICTMSVNRLKILRRFIGKIYLKNEDGLPDAWCSWKIPQSWIGIHFEQFFEAFPWDERKDKMHFLQEQFDSTIVCIARYFIQKEQQLLWVNPILRYFCFHPFCPWVVVPMIKQKWWGRQDPKLSELMLID